MSFRAERPSSANHWWIFGCACAISLFLIWTLKFPGALIAIALMGSLLMMFGRPDGAEIDAIKASIWLSAEDISDVIEEFDLFLTSPEVQYLEDRTLLRPELANQDTMNPQISAFHADCANAQRFLHRLPARLAGPVSIKQAEHLLAITDERAEQLRTSWLDARRSARGIEGPQL